MKDKLFYFLDYEGFRQVLKPLNVLTLPTQNELYGGPSGSIASPTPVLVVPVKNAITGTSIRRTPRFRRAQSTRFRCKSSSTLRRYRPRFRWRACDHRPRVQTTTPCRCRSPTTPTKATCVSTGRSMRTARPSCASATARKMGSTIRVFRFLWMARPTARSGFWTSRSRSAIPASSERTRFSTYGWAWTAPRPASTTSPSAIQHSTLSLGCPRPMRWWRAACRRSASPGFTGFGRQSTNPQWQDPALINPKVNYTWVKGQHSLKFG